MSLGIDIYESADSKRLPYEKLAEELCKYDVISFDLFDTLILRPFTSPRVLFSIIENRLGIYKFSKIRVDSEDEVRVQNQKLYNQDNTTLEEIYNLISKKTNLDARKTAQLEYDLELNYCYANPYFMSLVSLCKQSNKSMIICTDMYLSREQIKHLVSNVGYPDFDNIFVSSELKMSKKRGDLFKHIKDQYVNKRIIHIGDNEISDVKKAKEEGLAIYHYTNVNNIGGKTRVNYMSYITSRIYSAIVNNHLYSTNKNYDEEYKLGFIYGGIYVLGFIQWINKFAIDNDVDKILFLARDGDIYSKLYNLLPEHKNWEYFYWSRLAGAKFTAMENFYEFCQRMIWHKARGLYNIKIEHLLSFLGLESLISNLKSYNLNQEDLLTKETAPLVEQFFYDNKTTILELFKSDIDATIRKIEETVGNEKKIAIVDVGWAGTGPLIIKNIINKYLKLDCKVYSLLAGYRQPIENMAALYTMDDSIHSYLFSQTLNRDLMNLHKYKNKNKKCYHSW